MSVRSRSPPTSTCAISRTRSTLTHLTRRRRGGEDADGVAIHLMRQEARAAR